MTQLQYCHEFDSYQVELANIRGNLINRSKYFLNSRYFRNAEKEEYKMRDLKEKIVVACTIKYLLHIFFVRRAFRAAKYPTYS